MIRKLFYRLSGKKNTDRSKWDDAYLASKIEYVVDETDKRIRSIGSYQRKLKKSVIAALEHAQQIADQLPEPFECSKRVFTTDPRVRAMFVSTNDMKNLMHRNDELPGFFVHPDNDAAQECYAMMRVRRNERRELGTAMVNGQVMREVAVTRVSFNGHNLIASGATLQNVRDGVRDHIFETLVAHARRERAATKKRILEARKGFSDTFPKESLEALTRVLDNAGGMMALKNVDIAVDHTGTKIENCTQTNALCFNYAELQFKGGNDAVGMILVRIPRHEVNLRPGRGLNIGKMTAALQL